MLVAGCSPTPTPTPPAAPPEKTVFDPLTHQMDRAKAVQGTVDENAESTRKEIEAQEHGETRP